MSTEDGPGIRTTVFMKGCSLHCTWCHNPESIPSSFQVQWIGSRCIDCKTCEEVCPKNALTLQKNGMVIDRKLCDGCGICAKECPTTAMELLGEDKTVDELVAEMEKDRAYFENSGGGVTVSGGEPLLQADFVGEFLAACQKKGLQTALDTCGACKITSLKKVLPYCDMVLFDIKFIDPKKHKQFTGKTNKTILENLFVVRDAVKSDNNPSQLWIRTPLIPGASADDKNIAAIGDFLAQNLDGAAMRWELCAFNNLCKDKYTRLGLVWPYAAEELLEMQFISNLENIAKKSGVDPKIVFATGATKMKE